MNAFESTVANAYYLDKYHEFLSHVKVIVIISEDGMNQKSHPVPWDMNRHTLSITQ